MLCSVVTCYQELLHVVQCCYSYLELLRDVLCCYMSPRVITCCAVLLHVTKITYCPVLLHVLELLHDVQCC